MNNSRSYFPSPNYSIELEITAVSKWHFLYFLTLALLFGFELTLIALFIALLNRMMRSKPKIRKNIYAHRLSKMFGGSVGPVALICMKGERLQDFELLWLFSDQVSIKQWRLLNLLLKAPLNAFNESHMQN